MSDKLSEFLNIFIGLRKTIAWFVLMALAAVFRIKGYIDGGQFTDLSKAVFLGFVAGNMTEHLSTTVTNYLNSQGQQVKKVATDIIEGAGK